MLRLYVCKCREDILGFIHQVKQFCYYVSYFLVVSALMYYQDNLVFNYIQVSDENFAEA